MSVNQPSNVTFIGIGAIGLPMAERIMHAGFSVTGVDPFEPQRQKATDLGMQAAADAASAETADTVICMVATPDQLRTAALGEAGVLARMQPGATLIVMSTVGPEAVRELVEPAAAAGVRLLDIPVTGGTAGAAKGTLNLFASGAADAVQDNAEVLAAMGRVVDCGPEVGQGQAYKAVNQLLCSVHIVAGAEALAFAEKLGLDPAKVLPAVETGAGGSWMLSDRGPRMLDGLDATVTSAIAIFVKDSTLVCDIADQIGFDAPLVKAAQARYLQAREMGHDRRDDSQVIQTYLN